MVNDFSQGSVARNIINLALPMTLAQLINVLYNVVDRMYIGHIPDASSLAITGLGLTFPIITTITAFTNLFGMGGAPLCSIARGRGDVEQAETIMCNSFLLLVLTGGILTVLFQCFKDPILWLFGASADTFPYAHAYITIYLWGSIFVMIGLGMNSFINSQGFARIGMMTVLLGAIVNIILDPLFIFVFHMGVRGAALATVISQFLSALWVLRFLTSSKAILHLRLNRMKLQPKLILRITGLGLSSFVMSATNGLVQIACNKVLFLHGGDMYVGIMTVINSIREVVTMPVLGMTNAAQPVLGYNYGAGKFDRVKESIRFMSITCIVYTTVIWLCLHFFPEPFIHLFNSESELIALGVPAMNIYFFGFFMMSLQFSGQSVFTGLGKSKQAVFFSLLRKAIIVVPLTIFLPQVFDLGVYGVFLAEPISNFIGGAACFITMMMTVWRKMGKSPATQVKD